MKNIAYIALLSVLVSPIFASACIWDIDGIGYYGMMGYGGSGFFMVMGGIVWLVVGILAGVWLWQNINKK